MNMTTAQLQAFKTAIAANTNTVTFDGSTVAINAVPIRNEDGAVAIANFYNQLAAGPFLIFNTAVPVQVIGDNLLFSNYTIVTASPPDTTQLYDNCVEACIAKGIVLQNILLVVQGSGGTFNAARPNLRKGLKDATSNIPSGTPVTLVDGGWTTSIGAAPGILTRSATIFEALFAVASTGPFAAGTGALGSGGAQGTANVAVPATDSLGGYLQGAIGFQDVFNAWGS